MRMGTKSILMILMTLIIGMVIGFLISGVIARHRMQRFITMREPGRMVGFIERMIGPDESQREAVRAVLQKHSERFWKIHSRFESEMLALRDSLKKDLDPILTEEQKKRLERQPKPPKPFREGRPGPWKGHQPGHWPPKDSEQPLPPPPPEDGG
jgi:hypothetical protein